MAVVKVGSAQYPIVEHADFAAWEIYVEGWVRVAKEAGVQVGVFPEYGSMELVSFMDAEVKADIGLQIEALSGMRDAFCGVYARLAQQYGLILVAPSLPVVEAVGPVNRAYVYGAKGLMGYQDKFFMTRFEDEEWGIVSAPKMLTVFEADWGRFGVQICYDVEFGLGSGMLCRAGAEVILVPSCTETIRGATRVHVGARARALENQCYVVVSQTVGDAAWSPVVDVNYGYGAVYSAPDKGLPEEGIVVMGERQAVGWVVQELDLGLIGEVRRDGQVLNYRDGGVVVEGVEVKVSPV